MKIFQKLKNNIVNMFYPKHIKCIFCKSELSQKNVYDCCDTCFKILPFIKHNFCIKCGLKFEKDGTGTCLNCKTNNFTFNTARSALNFEGKVVNTIHKLKYARYKFLAEPLSYFLYDTLLIQDWKIDTICYVPLFKTRQKQRGYNQAKELAINLSKLTNIPVCDDIIRVRDTPTQTKLSRNQRQENVKNCFKVLDKTNIKDKNILIIDDVFTTGSTSNELSKQLSNSGANKIYVLTVSHAGFKQKI